MEGVDRGHEQWLVRKLARFMLGSWNATRMQQKGQRISEALRDRCGYLANAIDSFADRGLQSQLLRS
jgi:hypothetical protein